MEESVTHTRRLRLAELRVEEISAQLGSLQKPAGLHATIQETSPEAVDMCLICTSQTIGEAEQTLDIFEHMVRTKVGSYLFGRDDDTLPEVIGRLLGEQKLTVATMESLTGGLIASALTDTHDSSAHFLGGVVAYSTVLKEWMGVPHQTIERYGVISDQTARAMAQAVRKTLDIDIGLAITGVAGPGQREGHPVGTVFIAVAGPYGSLSGNGSRACAGPDREKNKQAATISALNLLRLYLERREDGGVK